MLGRQRVKHFGLEEGYFAGARVSRSRRVEADTGEIPIAGQPLANSCLDLTERLHRRARRGRDVDRLNLSHDPGSIANYGSQVSRVGTAGTPRSATFGRLCTSALIWSRVGRASPG